MTIKKISYYLKSNKWFIAIIIVSVYTTVKYKNLFAIEVGFLMSIIGMAVELLGTKYGWWKYRNSSTPRISDRVPVDAAISYFLVAVVGTNFILSRMGHAAPLQIMIEIGLATFIADIFIEFNALKDGGYRYKKSLIYTIGGRLPIEIPTTFLFCSMIMALYVFFRLGLI